MIISTKFSIILKAFSPKQVALCLGLLFFIQSFAASLQHSLTWDEPSFIAAGYAYLKKGEFRFNPSHPPLTQYLVASPLLAMELKHPPIDYENWLWSPNPVVSLGKALIYDGGYRPQYIALWSRLPVIFMGTFIVLAVFLWGRSLYGAWPALLGTAICAFCPNLIAHSGLATEDIGCTAFVLAACWSFWHACKNQKQWQWLLCGIITGLAFTSKYTSLALIPVFLTISVFTYMTQRSTMSIKSWIGALGTIFGIAFLVIGIIYGRLDGWNIYLTGLKSIYTDLPPVMSWYLLGNFSTTPWWYYTVIAFVLKTSPGIVILLLFATILIFKKDNDRKDTIFVLVPAIIFITISFFDNANFGLRRILPAFPFLYLFTSRIFKSITVHNTRTATIVMYLLLSIGIIETVIIYPNHLSYFSSAAGGPKLGPYLLNDSNIDWGQDLPALARWQQQSGTAELKFSYFGNANPSTYGVHAVPFPDTIHDLLTPAPGIYAVSVQNLINAMDLRKEYGPDVDWLRRYTPVAHAGYSIYIYKFQ